MTPLSPAHLRTDAATNRALSAILYAPVLNAYLDQYREPAMKKMTRRTISKGLAASTLSLLARPALAQGGYPAGIGTIKLVVPYPAGGATDVIGRIVADRLSAMWNANVIVENIAGAAANIGM